MGLRVAENLERKGQQSVTGQNGRRLVEGDMAGGLAAAQVVVVHRRQIVVHQGVAMDAFKSGARAQGACLGHVEQARTLHDEKRPQPFALRQRRIAHSFHDAPGRAVERQQLIQQRIDGLCGLFERVFECHADASGDWVLFCNVLESLGFDINHLSFEGTLSDEHGNKTRKRRSRWLGRLMLCLIVVLSMPFIFVVIYRVMPPPTSTLMIMRTVEGQKVEYLWRNYDQLSKRLVRAVAISEDAGICRHDGVDWEVLKRLVNDALVRQGEPVRGGSTIAMQTAKNLFLWPQRSYIRKAFEIPISLWIDYTWPKQRIVEIYLNIAEWGPGIFGAEAASRHYFKRSAANLSSRQAALLAAALPNPLVLNPGKPGPKLRRRAQRVAARMKGAVSHLKCLK